MKIVVSLFIYCSGIFFSFCYFIVPFTLSLSFCDCVCVCVCARVKLCAAVCCLLYPPPETKTFFTKSVKSTEKTRIENKVQYL